MPAIATRRCRAHKAEHLSEEGALSPRTRGPLGRRCSRLAAQALSMRPLSSVSPDQLDQRQALAASRRVMLYACILLGGIQALRMTISYQILCHSNAHWRVSVKP